MRLVVTGGRDLFNVPMVQDAFNAFQIHVGLITVLINGDAEGLDKTAAWVAANQIPGCLILTYPADWNNVTCKGAKIGYRRGMPYNKLAGFWRNQKMIDEGKPDWGMVFLGGNGTADMAGRLEAQLGADRVWRVTQ